MCGLRLAGATWSVQSFRTAQRGERQGRSPHSVLQFQLGKRSRSAHLKFPALLWASAHLKAGSCRGKICGRHEGLGASCSLFFLHLNGLLVSKTLCGTTLAMYQPEKGQQLLPAPSCGLQPECAGRSAPHASPEPCHRSWRQPVSCCLHVQDIQSSCLPRPAPAAYHSM